MEQRTVADLFERHHLPLFRYAYRHTRRRDLAEDIVQEVFVRVMRSRDTYEVPPSTRRELRHLVLTEGASHVLDFVESSTPTCAANLLIDVSAAMVGSAQPPAIAQQLLRYDLWLTQRDPSGREWTRHEVRTVPQGMRSEFRFEPLRWSTLALMPALKSDDVVEEHVFGALRGRIVSNGRLELSVSTTRQLVHGSGSGGVEMGTKVFTAGPGEAVAIELPAASGRSSAKNAAGVWNVLDHGQLFKDHTTAIVLTVNALEVPAPKPAIR